MKTGDETKQRGVENDALKMMLFLPTYNEARLYCDIQCLTLQLFEGCNTLHVIIFSIEKIL